MDEIIKQRRERALNYIKKFKTTRDQAIKATLASIRSYPEYTPTLMGFSNGKHFFPKHIDNSADFYIMLTKGKLSDSEENIKYNQADLFVIVEIYPKTIKIASFYDNNFNFVKQYDSFTSNISDVEFQLVEDATSELMNRTKEIVEKE